MQDALGIVQSPVPLCWTSPWRMIYVPLFSKPDQELQWGQIGTNYTRNWQMALVHPKLQASSPDLNLQGHHGDLLPLARQ